MEGKKILVLLSSFNGEKYIEQQIRSIMGQQGVQVDLKVRDDGSKDGTCAIVKKLSAEYPDRIQLIHGENLGLNASFFELINSAPEGYDYYSISDQDDVWLPDKLLMAVKALEKEKRDSHEPLLFASTSYLAEDDLKPYGQTRRQNRHFTIYNTVIQNICPGHTQVMNPGLLKLVQRNWDTDRIYVYDSWIMNMAQLYGKVVFSNTSMTLYRQHRDNQLGSGSGSVGQLMESGKRISNSHGMRYRRQVAYFLEMNEQKLSELGFAEEIRDFLQAESFIDRLRYCLHGKLCRQKRIETLAFYAAVIAGKF